MNYKYEVRTDVVLTRSSSLKRKKNCLQGNLSSLYRPLLVFRLIPGRSQETDRLLMDPQNCVDIKVRGESAGNGISMGHRINQREILRTFSLSCTQLSELS
jgi:hypothetical protein